MSAWRQCFSRFTALNYLLAAAVLFLALIPLHLHLHQDEHETLHGLGGTIDVHIAADIAHQAHHDHVVIMEVAPEALTAFLSDNPLPFLLLGFVLMALPVVLRALRLNPNRATRPDFRIRAYSHPPLRAPPQY